MFSIFYMLKIYSSDWIFNVFSFFQLVIAKYLSWSNSHLLESALAFAYNRRIPGFRISSAKWVRRPFRSSCTVTLRTMSMSSVGTSTTALRIRRRSVFCLSHFTFTETDGNEFRPGPLRKQSERICKEFKSVEMESFQTSFLLLKHNLERSPYRLFIVKMAHNKSVLFIIL